MQPVGLYLREGLHTPVTSDGAGAERVVALGAYVAAESNVNIMMSQRHNSANAAFNVNVNVNVVEVLNVANIATVDNLLLFLMLLRYISVAHAVYSANAGRCCYCYCY